MPGPDMQGQQTPPGHLLRPKAPRLAERLVKDFFAALDEQTVPGTETRPRFSSQACPDYRSTELVLDSAFGGHSCW